MNNSNVAIIGMGYVGLTLSVVLAKKGYIVTGIEKNKETCKNLKAGNPHFHERHLTGLLKSQINDGNLDVVSEIPTTKFGTFIICVGTPFSKSDSKVNMDYIKSASVQVSKHITKGALVILRSTVPVGTTRDVVLPILEEGSGLKGGRDFSISFAPERTIEGKAIVELETNTQIVGGLDPTSTDLSFNFFTKLTNTIVRVSSLEAAEMVKIMDNTYRDVRFAYSNEMSNICEIFGVDAVELIKAANTDYDRNDIPLPSPGVGGACLSKDPYILIDFSNKKNYYPKLIYESRMINENKCLQIANRIHHFFKSKKANFAELKIVVAGFAFKGRPETSDMRDSTTIWFLEHLKPLFSKSKIIGYDPVVSQEEIASLGIASTSDFWEASKSADAVLIMNNHVFFEKLDNSKLLEHVSAGALIYDSWRLLDSDIFQKSAKVHYMGVGL